MKVEFKGKEAYVNHKILKLLESNINSGSSLLDVGCGPKLYSNHFKNVCREIVTVDAFEWVEPDICVDLEKTNLTEIFDKKFDNIIMLDFLEHLDKEKGLSLLEDAKKICNEKIFVFTPMEEIWTDNSEHVENEKLWCYNNQFDLHKSLWNNDDFIGWNKIEFKDKKLKKHYIGIYDVKSSNNSRN